MASETKSLEALGAAHGRGRRRRRPRPSTCRSSTSSGRAYATGKRKNAIARVWVKPGKGKITVNGKDFTSISRVRCCR